LLPDGEQLAAFLLRRGPHLLREGRAREILDAVDSVTKTHGELGLDLLAAEAALVLGSWEKALDHLRPHSAGSDPIPAPVAWRVGFIHHMRGELDQAGAAYERG